jgi:DNA invertase Pin-like site-specific DNA recombinase
MAFSMASEIERDLISQRTKEALRYKKEQGIILGRPPGPGKSKLDKYRPEIEALLKTVRPRSSSPIVTTQRKPISITGSRKTASGEIRSKSYETFLPFVTI